MSLPDEAATAQLGATLAARLKRGDVVGLKGDLGAGKTTLAQIELWTSAGKYEKRVYTLPKHLDEKVARLHLEKIGVKLTTLRPDQAAYIGVAQNGPFKPDHYRF